MGEFFIMFDIQVFFDILIKYWPYFRQGIIYTLLLALFSVLIGIVLSFLITFLRMVRPSGKNDLMGLLSIVFSKLCNLIGGIYVEIIRSTPLLVQLMIVYLVVFGLWIRIPSFNVFGLEFIDSSRFIPGIIAIGINSAAYISEIIRGGIISIDRGQTEAARSLGMSACQNMIYVTLPQAIKNILPALGNEFVVVIKESSIGMVIGLGEIMYNANLVVGTTYRPLEPLIIASILYFILTYPTSKLISYLERRMSRGYN